MPKPKFLLESREGPEKKARISVIGWGEELLFTERKNALSFYEELRYEPKGTGLLYDGGPVGFVSYDAVEEWEEVRHKGVDDMGWPLAEFLLPKSFVVYDHILGRAFLCGKVEEVEADEGLELGEPKLDVEKEEFIRWVEEIKRKEEEGEAFQVVISKSYTLSYKGNLISVYERLSEINPSPFMYYLDFPSGEIIGSSPELLFRIEKGTVETYPIAGTRRRGKDPWEDLRLEEELLKDEKERAEHIMLVDLARNDLGKVCVPGTVKVTDFMYIEKYSHVQHLVSRVEGKLDPKYNAVDVFKAVFPAGTVSGAPKPSAMNIIGSLEKLRRGPYAGAVGFFSKGGAEFAIAIRTFFARENKLRLQAGAGIVYYSIPEREWMETEHKLRALMEAIR